MLTRSAMLLPVRRMPAPGSSAPSINAPARTRPQPNARFDFIPAIRVIIPRFDPRKPKPGAARRGANYEFARDRRLATLLQLRSGGSLGVHRAAEAERCS